MEKTIKLVMNENKNIEIFVNNVLKHTIPNSREIGADTIFELLDCKTGDHYSLQIENLAQKDEKVLECFGQLFKNIIDQTNQILLPPEDTFVEGSLTCTPATENAQQQIEGHTEGQN